MPSVHELKEQATVETPLLLFECQFQSGAVERWSTHAVEVDGQAHQARVLRHNLFEMRSGSDDGVDGLAKISLTLANADSRFSQIERQTGWKGARLTVRFLFYNLATKTAASDAVALFRGVAGSPDEVTESTFRVTFTNRLNQQRVTLPNVRIQRRCPWVFPASAEQRTEALDGGAKGKYSLLYGCGYSAGILGGAGNLDGGAPFASCDYTRAQCEARGMFDRDGADNATRRFGGIEFVPPSITVRSAGEKGSHASAVVENEARYNDFVPLVYGTAWFQPPITFARNDGNLTRAEALLGMGEVQGVLKVVANNVEIPQGQPNRDMTATGWYNLVSAGSRAGGFNADFTDSSGHPLGDPYGSMAVLSVVLPNRISDGRSLPKIEVLVEGLKLPRFDEDGNGIGEAYTNNPAWVLLDVLRRCGWRVDEIDVAAMARAAQHCDELVPAHDLNGNPVSIPRYQCNLVLRKRRSAADLVRGIRNGAGLMLRLNSAGLLELRPEDKLAVQHPTKPGGSNATEQLLDGWPAYEFGDGSSAHSGILRRGSGESTVRLWSRSAADSPNRLNLEFQDAFNEYQQDSLSLVHVDDVQANGQEVSTTLNALGLPNFDQAARVAERQLKRSVEGNTYAEFETSVRALHLRPGDLITLTYLKEGFQRQPFRIVSISPELNFRTARITGQIHSDDWYGEGQGGSSRVARRQAGFEVGVPRPLVGASIGPDGESEFGIVESIAENTDGSMTVKLAVQFATPAKPAASGAAIPLLSLSPGVESSGGTLAGGQVLYYAISAADEAGRESPLSFIVRASLPEGGATYRVALRNLSFSSQTTSFHVYRGKSPSQLLRIASNQAVAAEFQDAGASAQAIGPPDESYDHANFYWRLELVPECQATSFSGNSIGSSVLQMQVNEHRGATVRITRGKGAGQERCAASNDASSLTLTAAWMVVPDATSFFVISESSWRFGAAGQSSPVELEAPNREGATVQISGRAANVHDRECAYELSPFSRWRITGGAGASLDTEVAGMPVFALYAAGQGGLELVGVAFEDLTNTRTVTAGTLALHYWDELSSPSTAKLASGVSASGTQIDLTGPGPGGLGSLLQVGAEIMVVEAVENGGLRYQVSRGSHGSNAAEHASQAPVYHLSRKVFVIAFPRDFFGSPASGSFSYPVRLPDARVSAGEFFVTNSRGNSATKRMCWTATVDSGLRTLSGGQIAFQVEGPLAVETGATPPLVVQASHSVRDVFALLNEAPAGVAVELRVLQNDAVYCELTVQPGSTVSNVISGFGLPPLAGDARLTLDVMAVGQGADNTPGRDLTVTIRL
ncbi:MAG: phage tail protein [Bryobacterales bacterium]|nr:phage tail protein [Bryobacterales bacterium]